MKKLKNFFQWLFKGKRQIDNIVLGDKESIPPGLFEAHRLAINEALQRAGVVRVQAMEICRGCFGTAGYILDNNPYSPENWNLPEIIALAQIIHANDFNKLVHEYSRQFCNHIIQLFSEDEEMWDICIQIRDALKAVK